LAAAITRWRTSSLTFVRPLKTRETVADDTPDSRLTSYRVACGVGRGCEVVEAMNRVTAYMMRPMVAGVNAIIQLHCQKLSSKGRTALHRRGPFLSDGNGLT
jgi:hypothetical protein